MANSNDVILKARGIGHTYHAGGVDTPVLFDVDLDVRRAEFVMVMGPSGCGKTTLLNALGLMMRPSVGSVEIDGLDTSGLGDGGRTAVRRRMLGFVFQRFNLLPALTAEQNVMIALRLRGETADGRAVEALERVGLGHKRRSKPGALSMGEQQRVAIARALVGRPKLLLADEPTGNLDSANTADMLSLLAELNESNGLTTIMITHNEHLADRADRVLVMRDGKME